MKVPTVKKVIEEQLKKVEIAVIPDFDENTTSVIIKSAEGKPIKESKNTLEVGVKYSIVVANYIVKPFDGFTLHDNWNKGIVPTDTHMMAKVTQIMGKMVCIDAVGVSDNKKWCGWVPLKSILSFEEVE